MKRHLAAAGRRTARALQQQHAGAEPVGLRLRGAACAMQACSHPRVPEAAFIYVERSVPAACVVCPCRRPQHASSRASAERGAGSPARHASAQAVLPLPSCCHEGRRCSSFELKHRSCLALHGDADAGGAGCPLRHQQRCAAAVTARRPDGLLDLHAPAKAGAAAAVTAAQRAAEGSSASAIGTAADAEAEYTLCRPAGTPPTPGGAGTELAGSDA